jgi:hypothetical protein
MVGVLARRAYVLACQAKAADEVTAQLQAAYDYAEAHTTAEMGLHAVDDVADEITASCGRQYREPLRSFMERLKEPKAEGRKDAGA